MKDSNREHDTLLEWSAPGRPFKKRDASFYQTIAAMVFLLIVILFFLQEFLVIGVVLAVVFVGYALASVPPDTVIHKITKKGIWAHETFFSFSELSQFWFEERLENLVLIIHVPNRRSKLIFLVVPRDKKDDVKLMLEKQIAFRERPLKTLLDKLSSWVMRAIPLEEK